MFTILYIIEAQAEGGTKTVVSKLKYEEQVEMTFNASNHEAQRFSSHEPYNQRQTPSYDRRARFSHGRMAESEPVSYNDSHYASRSYSPGTYGDMPPPSTRAPSQKMTRFSGASAPPPRPNESWSRSPTPQQQSWNNDPHVPRMAPARQTYSKSSSPARVLNHSDQALTGKYSDHGKAISEEASKLLNDEHPPSQIKRKRHWMKPLIHKENVPVMFEHEVQIHQSL